MEITREDAFKIAKVLEEDYNWCCDLNERQYKKCEDCESYYRYDFKYCPYCGKTLIVSEDCNNDLELYKAIVKVLKEKE